MTRREAVIRMATLMGASVVGPRLLAASFGTTPAAGANAATNGFSTADIALLDEIGETIIPATDVPGAKAAGIGAFLAMMVTDCYLPRDQAVFKDGLKKIAASHSTRFGETFLAGSAANRTALLNELDREQQPHTADLRAKKLRGEPGGDDAPHYFRMMKELTILGYFSSEIGCKQAIRFAEVPGRYDGSAPYKKGEHLWYN